MYNKNNIDDIWKTELGKDAERIEIPDDLLNKINSKVSMEKSNKSTLKDNIANFIFPLNLNRLRLAFTAVMCSFLLITSILTFSTSARVFAMDSINKAVTLVYRVVGYDNGEYKVEQVPMEKSEWSFMDIVFYSDEFIEKDVGFPVTFPEMLPDGYNAPDTGRTIYASYGKGGKKEYIVSTIYPSDTGTSGIVLEIAGSKNDMFFKEVYNEKSYKVGDKKVIWGECPFPQYPGNDLRQKPTNIDLIHFLLWESDGIYYRLWRANSDLTRDEALNLAEAIIYNKCPKNEGTKFSGKKYDKDEISNEELEKQSGLKIKFPDDLAGSFEIENKTISALTENGENGHIVSAYYSNKNRYLKISITPMLGDAHLLNRGSSTNTKVLNIGNTECYWYEQSNPEGFSRKHDIIGWRADESDYLMEILDGSFDSLEEATAIVKSVIESK